MGLKEESTQRVLLTKKKLTFNCVLEIASAREAAERDVREFGQKPNSNSKEVHSVKTSSKSNFNGQKLKSKHGGKEKSKNPEKPCSGCGKNHWKADCPFKNSECYLCKRTGHIAKVCFSKVKPNKTSTKTYVEPKNVSSVESQVEGMATRPNDVSSEYIFTASSSELVSPHYVTLNINDIADVRFQVDTGCGLYSDE